MTITRRQINPTHTSPYLSQFDDFGIFPSDISHCQRKDNADCVIDRFFAGNSDHTRLEIESIARYINPGANFFANLQEDMQQTEDGFCPPLMPPSLLVENALREYSLTDLGAVALARLIRWDNQFIDKGWRKKNGDLTDLGILAYGAGYWRPLRVASSGTEPDNVTPSGVMMLPDDFQQEFYSTGDIAHPFAILHHELKAHVLPLKEGIGLKPGPKMEFICVQLESEVLREISLPERTLNWGKDGGTLDRTLSVSNKRYYNGLVRNGENGELVEINPVSKTIIGLASEIAC